MDENRPSKKPDPNPKASRPTGPDRGVVLVSELVPTPAVKRQLERQLMMSRTRLKDAWLARESGATSEELRKLAGTKFHNWRRNRDWTLDAVFNGELRTAPSCRKAVVKDIRGLERHARDPKVRTHLERIRLALDATEPHSALPRRSAGNIPRGCVYVAVAPTYFQLFSAVKVGCRRSAGDAEARMAALQATGCPERFLVLRLYRPPTGMTAQALEAAMHRELKARGYSLRHLGGGTEWFRSEPATLDKLARWLGATVENGPDAAAGRTLRRQASELLSEAGLKALLARLDPLLSSPEPGDLDPAA